MPRHYQEVEVLLKKLADSIHKAGLRADNRPSKEALASQQPFALDVMPFENWLQFIFLPKMEALVENHLPLPDKLALMPVAAQRFADTEKHAELLRVIRQIDELFNE